MANSYNAVGKYFDIDTSTNVAGLTSTKGGAPASDDWIYIAEGATVTVESNLSLRSFYLGDNQAGTASTKTGHIVLNDGIVITFGTTTLTEGFSGEGTTSTFTANGTVGAGTKVTCTTPDKVTNTGIKGCVFTATYTEFEHVYGFLTSSAAKLNLTNCVFNDCYYMIYVSNSDVPPTSLDGCTFQGCSYAIYDAASTTCVDWLDFFTTNHIKLIGNADGTSILAVRSSGITRYLYLNLSASSFSTVPTWDSTTGIQALTDNADGTLTATWNSATSETGGDARFRVYIRAGSAPDSFGTASSYYLCETIAEEIRIGSDASFAALVDGTDYYVIVRAVDDLGNEETNTTDLNVVATVPAGGCTSESLIKQIKGMVSLLVAELI